MNQLTFEGTKITHHLRFYQNIEYWDEQIELETFVHQIDVKESNVKQGKEITININTDIQNENIFYTDSNGLELQKRILNYRPTWNVSISEPSSANYYPITAMIYIEDKSSKKGMFVVNDRAQGGSSLKPGEVEIMIHRRLTEDDSKGVHEALDERDYDGKGLRVRMRHYIVFCENGLINENPSRIIQFWNDNKDILFFGVSELREWRKKPSNIDRILDNDFSQKLLLKTNLKIMNTDSYLLRFSSLDSVNTNEFYIDETKYNVTEVSLTATQNITEMRIMKNLNSVYPVHNEQNCNPTNSKIQIKPLQLKAFVIKKLKLK